MDFARPAPVWRRMAAAAYDALIVLALVMIVGLVAQVATQGQLVDPAGHVLAPWYRPAQACVVGGYFLLSWVRGGQTVGMRPWRIRVASAAGTALPWPRGVLRLLVLASPCLLLAAPLPARDVLWLPCAGWLLLMLPALVDPRRRGAHDWVAGSEVRPVAPARASA